MEKEKYPGSNKISFKFDAFVPEVLKSSKKFADNFLTVSAMLKIKISSQREKYDEHFENKSNAEFCIGFCSPREAKNASSIYPYLKEPILIRNDSLTPEEFKTKNPFVNTSYVDQVMSI